MNSNDSFKDRKDEKIPVDDYFDGIEHSSFQKRKIGFNFSTFSGRSLFVIGAAVIILVFLAAITLNKTDKSNNIREQEGIDARVKGMEERLADMEKLEHKLAGLENLEKKLGLLQDRMDRLEAGLASELNRMSSKFERSIDKISKKNKDILSGYDKKPSGADKKKGMPKSVGKHHTVHSGDTLYSIGRKYNLSLERLYRLNPSLSRNSSIHPGQKIRVSAD